MATMWYYSSKNQQKGPISWEELRGLASEGQLRNSDMVWQEGTPDWVRASDVRGLIGGGQGGASSDVRGDEPAPRRRPAREDVDIERRPSRRSSRQPQGSSKGLVIGLVAGGVTLVIIAIVVVIIIVANSGSGNKAKPGPGPIVVGPPPVFPPPGPGPGPIPVGGGRLVLSENQTLTVLDPRDTVFNGFSKTFHVRMEAGRSYTIDHISLDRNFDAILRVVDPRGIQLAMDDDGGEGLNSRLVFRPPAGDTYRVICTTLGPGQTGRFSLTVREN